MSKSATEVEQQPSGLAQPETVQRVKKPIWIDPPTQWENFDQIAYIPLPAVGAQANVISYQIPLGRAAIIKKVACNFVGGDWTEGSGAILWQILVDGAPPPGATSYDSIPASLGSPANPVELPGGFRVYENQVLSLVVKNVAVILAGQLSGGRLMGYLYPREMEDSDQWL